MNIIIKKSESLMRYLMVHHLSEVIPLYIVNEYPKSGGTWVSQMLAKKVSIISADVAFDSYEGK